MRTHDTHSHDPTQVCGQGIYLYCFARLPLRSSINIAGINGCQDVTLLEVNGVTAIVSCVFLEEFTGDLGEANMQDTSWIVPKACQHERVVEDIMGYSPVLPVRFGAVFSSREALERLLKDSSEEISHFLNGMSDKEEWIVKAFLETDKAMDWMLASDSVLAEQRRCMPASPGERYFYEKQLDATARKQLSAWCDTVAEELYEVSKIDAANVCPLQTRSRSATGKDTDMIFNCACLLFRDGVQDFRTRLDEAGAKYVESGLTLDISGPWPPYDFCPPIYNAKEEH